MQRIFFCGCEFFGRTGTVRRKINQDRFGMKKRGRPAKKAAAKDKKKVIEMLAERIPVTDIARVMKLSAPTFRKLFAAELISSKKKNPPPAKFKITKVHREKVIRHVGCKTPIADICRLVGHLIGQPITEDDLERYFAEELATGRVIYRDKVLEALETQMVTDGSASATNRLEAITVISDPAKKGATEGAAPAPAAHVIGKKAAARAEAAHAAAAGGKFAPPPPPRLIVNNGD